VGREKWSREEENLLREIYNNVPQKDLLQYFPNRRFKSITSKAFRLGLGKYSRFPNRPWTEEDVTFLRDNYYKSPLKSISERLHRPEHALSKKAQRIGLAKSKTYIAWDNDSLIKERYQGGETCNQIAEDVGIRGNSIAKHLRRQGYELRHRIYGADENFFEVIDTSEKAYFLGFLYADGCVYLHNNHYEITLKLQEGDGYILSRLGKLIYLDKFPLKYYIRPDPKHKNQIALIINSKKTAKDLMLLGCNPRKSLALEFPDFILDELMSHFIRGYFDGDGCIYIGKNKRIWSIISSNQFIIECQKYFLFKLGLNSYFVKHPKTENIANLFLYKKDSILKIIDYIYTEDMGDLYLTRKFDKCMQVKNYILSGDRSGKVQEK
jgi:hypothetical protein